MTPISGTGTGTLKTGAGRLAGYSMSYSVLTAARWTLYDNTSAAGTVLASGDARSPMSGLDVPFSIGLHLVEEAGSMAHFTAYTNP